MKIKRFCLSVLCLTVIGCGITPGQRRPNPEAIIHEMVAVYRIASSYQDSGSVRVISAPPKIANGLAVVPFRRASFDADALVSFKTYFVRPGMFRFDWKGSLSKASREASIWSDGKKVYQWMPSGEPDGGFELENAPNLQFAVDEARGSAGAAFLVPSMLIKEASYMSFADYLNIATELVLLQDEPVEGQMCFVIKANLSGAPWTLWIDKQSHLLRKTRTVYSHGSFDERVEKGVRHEFLAEEIRREIRINKPIAKQVFKYRPRLQTHDVDATR